MLERAARGGPEREDARVDLRGDVVARALAAALQVARGPVVLGLGLVVAAFLSAPTFAVWCLAFLNAKPAWAWRKDDDVSNLYAARSGSEGDARRS